MSTTISQTQLFAALDACAVFRPDYARPRVVLSIPYERLRVAVHRKWGGHMTGRRVVIDATGTLIRLLDDWSEFTTRPDEIRAMQLAVRPPEPLEFFDEEDGSWKAPAENDEPRKLGIRS